MAKVSLARLAEGGGSRQSLVVAPGINLQDYSLSWKACTVFRPVQPSGDDGQPLPMRCLDDAGNPALNEWLFLTTDFVAYGEKKFQSYRETLSESEMALGVSVGPYTAFYHGLRKLVNATKDGNLKMRYLEGSAGKGAAAGKPGNLTGFVQASMYFHDGKTTQYKGNFRENTLLRIGQGALKSINEMFELKCDDGQYWIDDIFAQRLALYTIQKGMSVALPMGWQAYDEQHAIGCATPKSDTDKGYGVTPCYYGGGDIFHSAESDGARFIPWNQVFRVLSLQEQMNCLCEAFDADIICRILGGTVYEQLLPPHVARFLNGVDQGPSDGGYAQQQAPQAGPASPTMRPAPARPAPARPAPGQGATAGAPARQAPGAPVGRPAPVAAPMVAQAAAAATAASPGVMTRPPARPTAAPAAAAPSRPAPAAAAPSVPPARPVMRGPVLPANAQAAMANIDAELGLGDATYPDAGELPFDVDGADSPQLDADGFPVV